MPRTVDDRTLCDESVAVPVTDWPAPSAPRIVSPVHDTRKRSLQVNWTVTGELFHPAAFGAGVAVPAIAGFVVSSTWTPNAASALLPAASVAVQVTGVVPSGKGLPDAAQ